MIRERLGLDPKPDKQVRWAYKTFGKEDAPQMMINAARYADVYLFGLPSFQLPPSPEGQTGLATLNNFMENGEQADEQANMAWDVQEGSVLSTVCLGVLATAVVAGTLYGWAQIAGNVTDGVSNMYPHASGVVQFSDMEAPHHPRQPHQMSATSTEIVAFDDLQSLDL